MYAQTWPRKRGRSKLPWQRAQIERVRSIQRAVQQIPAEERSLMQRALAKFLRANRGVRGTAAIRERDLQTAHLSGRLFRPALPDGTDLNPASVYADASDILDWLEPRHGSMVVRTTDGWLPTVNCAPGRVLVQTLSIWEDGCCPNAGIPPAKYAMGGHPE